MKGSSCRHFAEIFLHNPLWLFNISFVFISLNHDNNFEKMHQNYLNHSRLLWHTVGILFFLQVCPNNEFWLKILHTGKDSFLPPTMWLAEELESLGGLRQTLKDTAKIVDKFLQQVYRRHHDSSNSGKFLV